MGEGFVKLFGSILDSSVWSYDAETKIVWITILAMSDKDGLVHAAVPGIASRAGVSVKKTEEALYVFSEPDPYSRNIEHDGRRIERHGRDWRVLNYEYFRNLQKQEAEKARKRDWWRKNKGKNTETSEKLDETSKTSTKTRRIAEAEADTEADTEAEAASAPPLPMGANTPGGIGDTGCLGTLDLLPPSQPAVVTPTTKTRTKRKTSTTLARESKGGPTWEAYSAAYETRYIVPPTRNARANSLCVQLVDALGATEAPEVARYYLSTDSYIYANSGHTLALLVRDHQKIRTEMLTGSRISQSTARANDKSSGMRGGWARAAERVANRRGDK